MIKTSSIKDAQLAELLHNTNCILDLEGRILMWSDFSERLTGYQPQEVVGKLYASFLADSDTGQKMFQKALMIAARKGRFITEDIRTKKDGTKFWGRSIITLVEKGVRGGACFALITQDITSEKSAQRKREEYIGVASHELRNPLATLSLYSELLAKQLELQKNKESLHTLHDMQAQTSRVMTLIDDLLTVSNIEDRKLVLKKEEFNPTSFVRQIARHMQVTTRKHKIICEGTVAKNVRADKERITQVLINLISNAIKYSPKGSKIIVRIGPKMRKCVISVQDFGRGIAKSEQLHIFKRFFRSKDADTSTTTSVGLGLYISKEIIKSHREKIWVTSTYGKGATFSFTLLIV